MTGPLPWLARARALCGWPCALVLVFASISCAATLAPVVYSQTVDVWALPEGGVQPGVAVDGEGTLHVAYFRASERSEAKKVFLRRGDIFYVTREAGADDWSEPVRVNSDAESVGRICFPSVALGDDGTVHVGWVTMKPVGQWYARSTDGREFSEQRNLMAEGAVGVENGPAVVVDGADTVYVVWHQGPFRDEANRQVVLRKSTDGGLEFGPVVEASPADTGACACCGLSAHLDPQGRLYVSFRAAVAGQNRDMALLVSSDGGGSFQHESLDAWELNYCPTALTSLASHERAGTLVAWETKGRIYFDSVISEGEPIEIEKRWGKVQKHPSIAVNGAGEVLVAWAEIAGPKKRGLEWQVYEADGMPAQKRAGGDVVLPMASSPVSAARPDGSFVIVH